MAAKHLGKKGIFLTFIAISIITALIIIFMPSDISLDKDSQAVETRVSNVNEYVLDLENVYLERTMHATAIKTLIALIEYVEEPPYLPFTNEKYFNNTFSEVFLYGEIGGTPIGDMTGNTYKDRLDEIVGVADYTFNLDDTSSLAINEDYGVHVYQENPWFVIVEANVTILVSSETASWDKEVTIKTEIGIDNFKDPYYLVNTGGVYESKLSRSYTMSDAWDVAEVKAFIEHGNYTHFDNEQGPSFLMRFIDESQWEDNPNYDGQRTCCGIESLVNPNHASIDETKIISFVDYMYWGPSECPPDPPDVYTINGISGSGDGFEGFKLDLNSVNNKYLLTGNEVQYTCS